MTVIRHNSISGIVSITAAAGSNLSFYDSAGATLSLDTGNINAGVITATTANFTNATVTGDLTVQGTTTTLDTTVTEVDKLEVGANNTTVGVAITQSGTGDILRLYDGATEVFSVVDGGDITVGNSGFFYDYSTAKLGVGLDTPGSTRLHVKGHSSLNNSLLVDVNTGDSTLGFAENGTEKWRIENVTSADALRFYDVTNTAERLRINSNGDVGINTTTIQTKLDVFEPTGTNSSRALVRFQKDHTQTSVTGSTGARDQYPHALILENKDNSADTGTVSLSFSKFSSGVQSQAIIAGIQESAGNMALTLNTESGNSMGERLRITSNGNIGVGGITTPTFTTGGGIHLGDAYGIGFGNGDNGRPDFQIVYDTGQNNGLQIRCGNGADTADVYFTTAGNLAFASGKGIDFSATSDGSGTSTSELLDDYEEGTFTPVFGIGSGFTYSQQQGRYIKIGNRVIFNIFLTWSANSNTGGNTLLTGFPYASPNAFSSYGAASFTNNTLSLPSGAYNIVAQISPTSPNVYLYGAVSGGNKVSFPWQNLGSSGEIIMSGQYITV